MRLRYLFICFYFLIAYSSNAQQIGDFYKLDSLTERLNEVILNKDIKQEMITRSALFNHYRTKLADYTLAFEEGVTLEPLLYKHEADPEIRELIPPLLHGLGWLHHHLSQYEKSIEYQQKAMIYAKELGMISLLMDIKGSLGYNFYLIGRTREARRIMDELMVETERLGDKELIANSHYRLYTILIHNDDEQALFHSKASLNTSNLKNISHRYINVGTCFVSMGKLDSALYYTKLGEDVAKENHFLQQQSNALKQLVSIYEGLGDFENSSKAWGELYRIEMKLNSYSSALEVVRMQAEKMSLAEELSSEKLGNQSKIKWIGFIVSLILAVLLVLLANRLKLIRHQKMVIEQEKKRAEESEKHKEQFLANMSHEIRTPMNAILGITNSLLRNEHPTVQDSYLEAMKTSSENLLFLLDDILDFTKIDSGKLSIEEVSFDPAAVLQNVETVLRYRADDKDLVLHFSVDKNIPSQVIGDPHRLSQILINLVGNAIKFTDKGEITVRCCLTAKDRGGWLQFEVEDTGIGIAEDQQEKIFNAFEQGERSRSQVLKGTGLGLSISKKLIELHGGKIWVESIYGQGSVFKFLIPLKEPSTTDDQTLLTADEDIEKYSSALQGLRVLLAEDDEFNTMVITDDLNFFIKDLNLDAVGNGKEAVELFAEGEYDIILLDMQMPVLDGCGAAQAIRRLEAERGSGKKTPILALTANTVRSEIDKCLSSGMDDFIPKPYKPEKLIGKIHEVVTKDE